MRNKVDQMTCRLGIVLMHICEQESFNKLNWHMDRNMGCSLRINTKEEKYITIINCHAWASYRTASKPEYC